MVEMKRNQKNTNRVLVEIMKNQVQSKERFDRLCGVDAYLYHVTPREPVQEQASQDLRPEKAATIHEEQ